VWLFVCLFGCCRLRLRVNSIHTSCLKKKNKMHDDEEEEDTFRLTLILHLPPPRSGAPRLLHAGRRACVLGRVRLNCQITNAF
jgi:hypothetical protein